MNDIKHIFTLVIILIPCISFAWGPTGHRIVGEIAEKELNPKTLSKVKALLDNKSLAQVSTWADEIKSEPDHYGHTFSWHYMTWPTNQDEYVYDGQGELLLAIQNNLKVVKNDYASKVDRSKALMFLVHLVGDLHQPLHVGNGTDRGGNRCEVLFHGERVNLHHLWDEKLIQKNNLSYTEYVKFLLEKRPSFKASEMERRILSWARESKTLREQVYPDGTSKIKLKNSKSNSRDYVVRM
jgi:S1/P1 Nuclease.